MRFAMCVTAEQWLETIAQVDRYFQVAVAKIEKGETAEGLNILVQLRGSFKAWQEGTYKLAGEFEEGTATPLKAPCGCGKKVAPPPPMPPPPLEPPDVRQAARVLASAVLARFGGKRR